MEINRQLKILTSDSELDNPPLGMSNQSFYGSGQITGGQATSIQAHELDNRSYHSNGKENLSSGHKS